MYIRHKGFIDRFVHSIYEASFIHITEIEALERLFQF